MATVHIGKRWDQALGDHTFHSGTLAYLAMVRAVPVPDTAKEVPEASVDPEGKYLDA